MRTLVVEGKKFLSGAIPISGSKNATLPVLIATLLTDEKCIIENVPDIVDVRITIDILKFLGKRVEFKNNVVSVSGKIKNLHPPYELVNRMRASVLVVGPILARKKEIRISIPGGCSIGPRPINIHIDGFKKLGSEMEIIEGDIYFKTKGLKGGRILLDYPSVGATENLLLASSCIKGEVILENVAQEPEIKYLIEVLRKMGVNIEVDIGKIKIKGKKTLSPFKYRMPSDRIEAGTFLILSATCSSEIVLKDFPFDDLEVLLDKSRKAGIRFKRIGNNLKVLNVKKIYPVDIETSPFPGFPTDLQPMWAVLMTRAEGKSIIIDNVFPTRFAYIDELRRLGADIFLKNNTCEIKNSFLKGARVRVTDLRAGAALLIAGLFADGMTYLEGYEHLERGYENLINKLSSVGAKLWIE